MGLQQRHKFGRRKQQVGPPQGSQGAQLKQQQPLLKERAKIVNEQSQRAIMARVPSAATERPMDATVLCDAKHSHPDQADMTQRAESRASRSMYRPTNLA